MIKLFCDCCNREITAAEAGQTQLIASELIKGVQVEVTANVKVDKNRHVCAVCVSGVLRQLRPVTRPVPALPMAAVAVNTTSTEVLAGSAALEQKSVVFYR